MAHHVGLGIDRVGRYRGVTGPPWKSGRQPHTRHTAPASPWQNGFAEQLIGLIRRECLDHVIILGEAHLRRVLQSYADYYNNVRTHRSLKKDAPIFRPVQRTGAISSRPVLGGLHHHYARA
ncbi:MULTISPECIES: integrase core domain-containing protein [Bradyrhizobium]|uniref:integrase core domain-containing protein n=1 Tax=Bradyrhizobium elkanii TaxID=29448 RepID=UPI0009B7DF40|nr:integrase core domain-containing protein [Bradyrhizobium elkanii]